MQCSTAKRVKGIVSLFSDGMSYPCPFSSCNLFLGAVLVCPPKISLFVVLSCHLVFRMYLRHLLMNVCSIRVVVLFTLHVSEPCSSTLEDSC